MSEKSVYMKSYYENNKEHRLDYQKDYNHRHKQKIKEYQRVYHLQNKDRKNEIKHKIPKKECPICHKMLSHTYIDFHIFKIHSENILTTKLDP